MFGNRSRRIRCKKDLRHCNLLCSIHVAKGPSERHISNEVFDHTARKHLRVRQHWRDRIDGDIASTEYSGEILNHTEAHARATEESI